MSTTHNLIGQQVGIITIRINIKYVMSLNEFKV